MDAGCPKGAGAGADGDFASLEVAEELFPFVVAGGAVFLGGPQGASSGEEAEMGLDGLFGIDGVVAHGDVDVAVAGDDLGDVGRQAVQDGVGDEHPAEVMGCVMQRGAAVVDQAGLRQGLVEEGGDQADADGMVFAASSTLEQQRRWWLPQVFAGVAGGHQGHPPAAVAGATDDGAEYVGQFGADEKETFGVGLGRGDLEQRNQFSGGREAILDQAVMAELEELLDPDAGEAQDERQDDRV